MSDMLRKIIAALLTIAESAHNTTWAVDLYEDILENLERKGI